MPDLEDLIRIEDLEGGISDTSQGQGEITIHTEAETREIRIPAEYALFQSLSRLALTVEDLSADVEELKDRIPEDTDLHEISDDIEDFQSHLSETDERLAHIASEMEKISDMKVTVKENQHRVNTLALVTTKNVLVPFGVTFGGGLGLLTIWLMLSGSLLSIGTFILTVLFGAMVWKSSEFHPDDNNQTS